MSVRIYQGRGGRRYAVRIGSVRSTHMLGTQYAKACYIVHRYQF